VYRDVEEYIKERGTVRLYDRLYYISKRGYLTRESVFAATGRDVG